MQMRLAQSILDMMRTLNVIVAAATLCCLAACAFVPLEQGAPNELQITELLEKKLQSSSKAARVLNLDVTDSWFDGQRRYRLICVAQIDGGPPVSPVTGYVRVQVRKLELILEKQRTDWRLKRVTARGLVQLLPAIDT